MEYWTPERDAQLTELIEKGLTAAQIGIEMGVTRNAVIGRKNRLKMRMKSNNPNTPMRNRPLGQSRDWKAKLRIYAITCDPVPGQGVPFVDAMLEDRCMWFLYQQAGMNGHVCGGKRFPGARYCANHVLLAHQPASSGKSQRRAAA